MHKVLQRLRSSDSGMSLLEVLVAMMIFAIVSLGVLQTLATVLTTTRDNRARIVAANLASQEIDLARDASDIFTLFDDTYTRTLNGDTFTVTRSTKWVATGNTGTECGAGNGALRYKRVNVEVTWPNMRVGTDPVRFDTLLAPDKRINDPELGTILISVRGGSGDGVSGVSVTATPSSPAMGAQPLTETVSATDVQGCTFILKVVPGHYDVQISRSGYITDKLQATSPTELAQVAAGGAASLSFNYDEAATFVTKYVANPAPTGVQIPNNMATTFVSSYGAFVSQSARDDLSRNVELFPWRSGYTGIAGDYSPVPEDPASTEEYCASRDAAEWRNATVDGVVYSSPAPTFVAAAPGSSVDLTVPMGLVSAAGFSGERLRATSVDPLPGSDDPGCTKDVELTFDRIDSSTTHIALPYGTWKIEKRGIFGGWSSVSLSGILDPILGTGSASAGVVTVDPRVAIS